MSSPLLEVRDVRKEFGDVVANESIDFDLREGEIHSILGENGAGKSTFMKILYGVYDKDGGEIRVKGTPRNFDAPGDALDQGIGLVYQEFKLIPTFTVLENIILGLDEDGALSDDVEKHRERLVEKSKQYGIGLGDRLDWRVSELSEGEKQRVEILKTLYRDVEILLLDEPTSILTPQEVDQLFEVLDRLVKEEDLGIVFITHKLDEVLAVSDRVTVFRDGIVTGTTTPAEADQTKLAQMMVGREDVTLVKRRERESTGGSPLLEVSGLTATNERNQVAVDDVSFTVDKGEIFCVVGVEGNGQQEMVEVISGLRTAQNGTIHLDDAEITVASRSELQDAGMTLVPDSHGVIEDFTISDNCILDNHHEYFDRFRDKNRIRETAEDLIEQFNVKVPGLDATASKLSGGNKQKVVLGRKLTADPRRLTVAFNPTKGLDIDTKSFIHDRLIAECDEGRAVFLVTTDLEEALAVSDRLAVINEGQFVSVYDDPEEPTREKIGYDMTRSVGDQ